MTAAIIDGKKCAQDVKNEVARDVARLKHKNITPGLAAVLVGDDPASAVYVRNKRIACNEVGIYSEIFKLPEDTEENDLINLVKQLNEDEKFHGILIQLPLPKHLNERSVIEYLSPEKDVDCLHTSNMGKLVDGSSIFIPGTPAGIQELLKRYEYSTNGKHVVICGRSNIVGKPAALLFIQRGEWGNATVTVCHTGTKNLSEFTRTADILIAAVGQPKIITADFVKDGAIIIDVGINRVTDNTKRRGYRLVGDVDFDNVIDKVSAITPVPGGVGPMTVAMLLLSTLNSAKQLSCK